MTAPGPVDPTPGGAAFARRSAGATWVLSLIGLLAALLVVLPAAGSAAAATPPGGTAATPSGGAAAPTQAGDTAAPRATAPTVRKAATSAAPAAPGGDAPFEQARCLSDGPLPGSGHGCSGSSWCGQQSQLPNAPPQPGPAALPLLVPPCPAPVTVPLIAAAWPAPTPDLHLLQVNRP
jgi:hypothetical protein